MSSSAPRAAVIDVGSNSIKILIAHRDEAGHLVSDFYRTLDARISKGIAGTIPRLSEEGIQRGLEAILDLLGDARRFEANRLIMVATSAVRDAANGSDFAFRVAQATGHSLRILSGDEEAHLIGRGLTCDPALRDWQDFYLFDLGGGSLEILAYRDRSQVQGISLPLGCVRLTEKFIANPAAPITAESLAAIRQHTQASLRASGFRFSLPPTAPGVGTGGTVTTARAIFAARAGKALQEVDTVITVEQLRELLATLARAPLEDRRRLPGMPPNRADVFPTALATLVAVAEVAGLPSYVNSIYNLRWGLAAELLP